MSLTKLIEAVEAGKSKSAVMYSAIGICGGAEPATIGGLPADQWQNVLGALDGSLDAAKRLHDALLPGWVWLIRSTDDDDVRRGNCQQGQFLANIWGEGSPNEGAHCFPTWADNPARAWLLCILRALEQEGR